MNEVESLHKKMIAQARAEQHVAAHSRREVAKIGRNPITAHDMIKIRHDWLNDDVINFYINLIITREAQKGNKIAALPTLFWVQYNQKGWKSVARWPKRAGCGPGDIQKCSRVFVPVNPGNHWFFGCIDMKNKRFEVYDSLNNHSVLISHKKVYTVRHSVTSPPVTGLLTVPQCLHELYSEISGDKERAGWKDYYLETSPQQSNFDDCGVFMLKGIEVLSRDGQMTFNQQDIQRMRPRMFLEIMYTKLLPLPNCRGMESLSGHK